MPRCQICDSYYMGDGCPFCEPDKGKKAEIERKEREARAAEYELKSEAFLMTTGNDFNGYEIKEYLGIISDGVIQGTGWLSELSADINDILGSESNTFAKKLRMCRESALEKIKRAAIEKNANALVSVDFETMTLRNNMIGVMVSGTAVRIEKTGETEQKPSAEAGNGDSPVPVRRSRRMAAFTDLDD
ncbi:MAG: heavy metal-binding domain-containing protein [Clostridia bacterium]|nr:heavy metal-binding domain-containing protein [Clostridia bacterium]